jgi:phage tail protein X
MNVDRFDYVTVETEYVTVDLIVWKHYRQRAFGVVEKTLDVNPHLAKLHRESPFLPVGTQVRIPIDEAVMAGRPKPSTVSTIAGRMI